MKMGKEVQTQDYKHHINKLNDLEQRLEEMGIPVPDDNINMWVFLQSFPDDDILIDKYIYNFGIMDEEMKRQVGKTYDYGIYLQTIVEMKFSDFKVLYQEQAQERESLYLQYPGLIMNIRDGKKVGRKKIKKLQKNKKDIKKK